MCENVSDRCQILSTEFKNAKPGLKEVLELHTAFRNLY